MAEDIKEPNKPRIVSTMVSPSLFSRSALLVVFVDNVTLLKKSKPRRSPSKESILAVVFAIGQTYLYAYIRFSHYNSTITMEEPRPSSDASYAYLTCLPISNSDGQMKVRVDDDNKEHAVLMWVCYEMEYRHRGKCIIDQRHPLHINRWDVSLVTDMSSLFASAASFNEPLDKWDVSNVTSMKAMFLGAESFNQPLDKWCVSRVTTMEAMFTSARVFDQPLNSWDTSAVTIMDGVFCKAASFNQPLNSWNTSSVRSMNYMFSEASSFDKSLDKWDVSRVLTNIHMFRKTSKT